MEKTFDDNEFLWSQFIRLGEMLIKKYDFTDDVNEELIKRGVKF